MFTQITIGHQCEFYEIKIFNGYVQIYSIFNVTQFYNDIFNEFTSYFSKWKLKFQTWVNDQCLALFQLVSDKYENALQFLKTLI